MRSRRRRGGGLEDEEAMERVGRTLEHPRTGQAITKLENGYGPNQRSCMRVCVCVCMRTGPSRSAMMIGCDRMSHAHCRCAL